MTYAVLTQPDIGQVEKEEIYRIFAKKDFTATINPQTYVSVVNKHTVEVLILKQIEEHFKADDNSEPRNIVIRHTEDGVCYLDRL